MRIPIDPKKRQMKFLSIVNFYAVGLNLIEHLGSRDGRWIHNLISQTTWLNLWRRGYNFQNRSLHFRLLILLSVGGESDRVHTEHPSMLHRTAVHTIFMLFSSFQQRIRNALRAMPLSVSICLEPCFSIRGFLESESLSPSSSHFLWFLSLGLWSLW
jgi:hypothetical protein